MSASTNSWSRKRTTPEVGLEGGERVVGDLGLGGADRGDQRGLARRSGSPTSAASASSFTSRRSQCSSPYSPCSAKLGARRAFDRKRALPRPPRPPCDGEVAVAVAHQVGEHLARRATCTTVPSGTATTRSAPLAPCRFCPLPCLPDARAPVRMVAEREQRRDVAVGPEVDVAAGAAVAAVGAALRARAPPAGTPPRPRRRRHRGGSPAPRRRSFPSHE